MSLPAGDVEGHATRAAGEAVDARRRVTAADVAHGLRNRPTDVQRTCGRPLGDPSRGGVWRCCDAVSTKTSGGTRVVLRRFVAVVWTATIPGNRDRKSWSAVGSHGLCRPSDGRTGDTPAPRSHARPHLFPDPKRPRTFMVRGRSPFARPYNGPPQLLIVDRARQLTIELRSVCAVPKAHLRTRGSVLSGPYAATKSLVADSGPATSSQRTTVPIVRVQQFQSGACDRFSRARSTVDVVIA